MSISINNCTAKDIEDFMFLHSKEFITSFAERVDICSYSKKIRTNAETIEYYEDNVLEGLLCCYLNEEMKQIYIPYICVSNKLVNKGIGTHLFNKLLDVYVVGKKKYSYIRLEVNKQNIKTQLFYKKLGFILEKEQKDNFLLAYEINKNKN